MQEETEGRQGDKDVRAEQAVGGHTGGQTGAQMGNPEAGGQTGGQSAEERHAAKEEPVQRTDRPVSADDPDQQQTYPDPNMVEATQRAANELTTIRTKLVGIAEAPEEYPADAAALEGQLRDIAGYFGEDSDRAGVIGGFADTAGDFDDEPSRDSLMELADKINEEIQFLLRLKPGQVTGPTP